MLEWTQLLNTSRRKYKNPRKEARNSTKGSRNEMERDYDRILFATPTRRLADKTQVFPLDSSDSVRTRLTHSYEVSNLARSIGMSLSFDHAEQVFGPDHEKLEVKRKIPAILAAIGLAHDLGNPPFGHQGEEAVSEWFSKKSENEDIHPDFIDFDGNPQSFRLVTRLQILNDDFGLNLTYGTLAALIKYPVLSESVKASNYDKFGVFESEKLIANEVWNETGLSDGDRHPLTYIMEACDDIAYAVLDAEDTVKKGFASFYDLIDHLESNDDEISKRVVEKSKKKNAEFKKEQLSSAELNDISIQIFRVHAIFEMVNAVTNSFVEKSHQFLAQPSEINTSLIKMSAAQDLSKSMKKFDIRHGFANKSVLRLELEGHNYITSTMDMLWAAITDDNKPFARYAKEMISENYWRAYESSKMPKDYKNCQLLSDSISGMTDSFLIKMHNDLRPLYDGFSKN